MKFVGQKKSIKAKQNKVQIKSNVYSDQKLTDDVQKWRPCPSLKSSFLGH